jgi:hypothetical protein
MRTHSGKPFPSSFYDRAYKSKHYMIWWCICNELDADADGWIRISRSTLERVFVKTQRMKHAQITAIMQTIAKDGYLELHTVKGARDFSTELYEIRVIPSAWESQTVVKKQYARTQPRNYYREKKARLLAEALAAGTS